MLFWLLALLLVGSLIDQMLLSKNIRDNKTNMTPKEQISAILSQVAHLNRRKEAVYGELMDMGKELEENENGFFLKKQLKYFGTVSDRADRLMGRAGQLLEYAKQVQDAYQAQVDARQNKNMEFLTVISTIFFPLTLITGWFGMNFQNMPELENGYPGVIILSLVVVIGCILFFKRKKML